MTSDQSPQTPWTEAIRTAMQGYARVLSESSRELASSAERFAAESLHAMEQVAERASAAAATSTEMAAAAGQAATEARRAVEGMAPSAPSGVEAVQVAAKDAVEAINQTINAGADRLGKDATLLSQQLKADLQLQAQDALEQIRLAAGSSQDAAAAAQQAAMDARTAANDSSAHFGRAQEAAASPKGGPGTRDLLERLEADYELITHLVQELHNRIASLPTPSIPEPAPAATYEWEPSLPPREPEAVPAYPSVPESEHALPKKVAGRVLVTITPVPDFDRLLNLDGALGRMDGIANVSLADYAKDEVTFRLEIEEPMTADDFARSFSESTGSAASVAATEEGKLALRLAS